MEVNETKARQRAKVLRFEAWKKGEVPDLVEVEESQPNDKPSRILDPKLEAWKKGVVPDLDPEEVEAEEAEAEEIEAEVNPSRALDPKLEAWKKGLVPDSEEEDDGRKTHEEGTIGIAF